MPCPYVIIMEEDDPMNMVRHNDVFIQKYIWKVRFNFLPTSFYEISDCRILKDPVLDTTKCWLAFTRNDRYEISSRLRVIIFWQADGTPSVLLGFRSYFHEFQYI